jgi:hypothetical protein
MLQEYEDTMDLFKIPQKGGENGGEDPIYFTGEMVSTATTQDLINIDRYSHGCSTTTPNYENSKTKQT